MPIAQNSPIKRRYSIVPVRAAHGTVAEILERPIPRAVRPSSFAVVAIREVRRHGAAR